MNFTTMNSFTSTDNKGAIKCPVCEKMFKPAPEHAYKIGKKSTRLVCSYSCARKWEKEKTEKLTQQKPKPPAPIDNTTGETIRTLRRELGITQKELGEKLFKREKEISHYEKGYRKPNNKTLTELAEIFGVSVDVLKGGAKGE